MRAGGWLLTLALACGEAPTTELIPARTPPPSEPRAPIDGGVAIPDAAVPAPFADIVPSTVDFDSVGVGAVAQRALLAVNRTQDWTTVWVTSIPPSFPLLGPDRYELPPRSSQEIPVGFAPRAPGIHDAKLELDACGAGCTTHVRLVGFGVE